MKGGSLEQLLLLPAVVSCSSAPIGHMGVRGAAEPDALEQLQAKLYRSAFDGSDSSARVAFQLVSTRAYVELREP